MIDLHIHTDASSDGQHSPREIFKMVRGLLITAGSDFHGKAVKPDVDLGQGGDDHYDLLLILKKWRKDRR